MNKLSKRAWLTMVLALVLLGGLAVILVQYAFNASQWAAYRSVALADTPDYGGDAYTVYDRSGSFLMEKDQGRNYSENPSVRKAMLHILGDNRLQIQRVILEEYSDDLIGYDRFSGSFGAGTEEGNMQLTVSAQVQAAAQDALAGQKGVIGVYNYQTGEILCMVSSPNYDPTDPPVIDEEAPEFEAVFVNRFTGAAYIPGSIFKVVTAAAALEEIGDIEERIFTCEGQIEVDGETIVCNGVHGQVDLQEALCRSCNVAFAQIAVELGARTLTAYAEKLGICDSLSFDGYDTKKGNIDLKDAGHQSIAWAGIGQYNDLINPCQFMTLMGAIANGGVTAEPYLVQQVCYGDRVKYEADSGNTNRILRQETADRLAEMMHYAVVNNYGEWYFSGLYAGAKSGTAEQGDGDNDALFAGFIQDPDYPLAFIIIVEGGGAGSSTCTPMLRQVLDACIVAINQ